MLFQVAKMFNRGPIPVKRRKFSSSGLPLTTLILVSILVTDCRMIKHIENRSAPESNKPAAEQFFNPDAIHRRAMVIDMHADTTQRLGDEGVDRGQTLTCGHFDSIRAKAGRVDAQFVSLWVDREV